MQKIPNSLQNNTETLKEEVPFKHCTNLIDTSHPGLPTPWKLIKGAFIFMGLRREYQSPCAAWLCPKKKHEFHHHGDLRGKLSVLKKTFCDGMQFINLFRPFHVFAWKILAPLSSSEKKTAPTYDHLNILLPPTNRWSPLQVKNDSSLKYPWCVWSSNIIVLQYWEICEISC